MFTCMSYLTNIVILMSYLTNMQICYNMKYDINFTLGYRNSAQRQRDSRKQSLIK